MLKIITICLLCITLPNFTACVEPTQLEPEALTDIVNDVAFYKIGTYRGFTNDGAEYQKTFFFPKYSTAPWAESKAICKAFDFELVTLETLDEAKALLTMTENHSNIKSLNSVWLWIDAISILPKTTTSWYWSKTGKKVSFPIMWTSGQPSGSNSLCLAIGKSTLNQKFEFYNGNVNSELSFACQRIEFYIPFTNTPDVNQNM